MPKAPNKPAADAKDSIAEQFAEADAKAEPATELTPEQIEEIQVGLQVRGF